MTEAVGYEIVSGWTIVIDTRMIGHDGTSSRTSYPTRRQPGTTWMTTLVPIVLLLQILNRMTEAVGYEIVSGWTSAIDTRMIGHDGTSSTTSYPTQRRPGTTRMTTIVPVV